MKFILCVLWSFFWWSLSAHSLRKKIGVGELKTSTVINELSEDWFTQKLDHFNPSDKRTWQQRFQLHYDYYDYKENAPVFIMVGGEDAISASWMYSGSWIEYAKKFHAVCVQLEHRYYGLSHPTKDLSTKNLKYLSSEQALADIAEFVVAIQNNVYTPTEVYVFPRLAKVIIFGASYGGSLAAWMRLKYPHLVHAAVSSSAPLLAIVDFYEYYSVVEKSLSTYNPECVLQIRQANEMLNNYLSHKTKTIEEKFKLCEPFDSRNKKNTAILFERLASNFGEIVQYNEDNRYHNNPNRNLINIDTVCDIMVNKSIPTPLDRYAEVNNLLLDAYGDSCISINYTMMLSDYYLNTSWDASFGGRQWMYQSCTEFGFCQTSDQQNHTFSTHFPVEFFIDMCIDIFGKSFGSSFIKAAVERTNMMYGGLNIKESRVIYVNGNIDPWHVLGVTKTRNNNTKAIFINGTSHCADAYSSEESDPPQLTNARETVKEYLKQWLMEDDEIKSHI